jgi:capsular polysaccharide biosynthesis protein
MSRLRAVRDGVASLLWIPRRARWPLPVAGAALAGLLLGYLVAAWQPVHYEAVARVLVAEPAVPEGGRPVDLDRVARNQAELMLSSPVLEDAARRAGGGLDPDTVRRRVTVEPSFESNLITVRALDPTPEGAAHLADSVVRAYDATTASSSGTAGAAERLAEHKAALRARFKDLTAGRAGERPDGPTRRAELAAVDAALRQVVSRELQAASMEDQTGAVGAREPAEVPQGPVQPRPARTMAAGVLLGLAVAGVVAWARRGGPTRSAPARPFRWFGVLLGVLLIGYMFFSKAFAYLVRIPGTPMYAGELLLAVGLVEAVRARSVLRQLLAVSAPLRILLALIAVAGVRLLWDLPLYGMDAIRDYSVFYYGSVAFLVAAAAMSDPTFTPRLLRWYRRVLPWFLLWVPVAVLLARHQPLATVNIPGSTTPVNTFKGSDLVVMTTMALVFLWLGVDRGAGATSTRRRDDWLTGVGVVALLVLCSQSRVAMVVILAVFGTALLFLPNGRRRRIVLALGGGIALVVVPVLVLNLNLELEGRRVSLQQVADNVTSVFSRDPLANEAETGLQGTVRFRRELFGTVLERSLSGDRVLTGQGFGPILSSQPLGRQPQGPGAPPPLRSAHNSHLTVLARLGVVCFGLWVLLWVVWLRHVGRVARLARHGRPTPAVGLGVWAAAGVVGLLVVSFDDPTLETPQGAIWLWTLVGLAVAHVMAVRAQLGAGYQPAPTLTPA